MAPLGSGWVVQIIVNLPILYTRHVVCAIYLENQEPLKNMNKIVGLGSTGSLKQSKHVKVQAIGRQHPKPFHNIQVPPVRMISPHDRLPPSPGPTEDRLEVDLDCFRRSQSIPHSMGLDSMPPNRHLIHSQTPLTFSRQSYGVVGLPVV